MLTPTLSWTKRSRRYWPIVMVSPCCCCGWSEDILRVVRDEGNDQIEDWPGELFINSRHGQ